MPFPGEQAELYLKQPTQIATSEIEDNRIADRYYALRLSHYKIEIIYLFQVLVSMTRSIIITT